MREGILGKADRLERPGCSEQMNKQQTSIRPNVRVTAARYSCTDDCILKLAKTSLWSAAVADLAYGAMDPQSNLMCASRALAKVSENEL